MYLMAGALQHNGTGDPAFLHRVSEGAKFDPTRAEVLRVDHITTPIRSGLPHANLPGACQVTSRPRLHCEVQS